MNRILIALSASFALGGCLLSPGTFSSELHLYSDERFSFAYDGEIEMLALSQLAQMNRASEERFEAGGGEGGGAAVGVTVGADEEHRLRMHTV